MSFVVGTPLRPAIQASSLRGGGPKCLKIGLKISFFELVAWTAGPQFGEIWSKSMLLHCWTPLSGAFRGLITIRSGAFRGSFRGRLSLGFDRFR